MKVHEKMTREVQCCGPDTNLAAAAKMMWDTDCGALPVLNVEGRVIGMITDRDICMAVATKSMLASEITVWETCSGKVVSCRTDDDVQTAMDIMKRERVHRLPVVDDDGYFEGILSTNDLILSAAPATTKKGAVLSHDDVMATLKAISAHRILVGI